MAYDLEEQESIDQMKAWWEKWGTPITAAVCVVCFSFAGWNGWQWWQRKQADEAAMMFAQYQQAVMAQNTTQMQSLAANVLQEYAGTIYAPMTAMTQALVERKAGNIDGAIQQLQWIVQQEKHPEYDTVIRVRLASLFLEQQKFDQALQSLEAAKPTVRQEVLVRDRMADVYFAKGDVQQAKAIWQELLARSDIQNHPLMRLIELKLSNIATN